MSDDPDAWRRQCVTEGGVLVGTATGWHCRSMSPPACALCGGWYGGPGCYGQCEQLATTETDGADEGQQQDSLPTRAFDWCRGSLAWMAEQQAEAMTEDGETDGGQGRVEDEVSHPTPTTAAVDALDAAYREGVEVGMRVMREQMMREQAACVWPGSRGSEAAGKAAAVSKARQRQSKAKQKQEEDKQSK